jgi:hypothetical protein
MIDENHADRVTGRRQDQLRVLAGERIGLLRLARVAMRPARSRRRLTRLPTVGHVQTMVQLDGREPCSFLLDARAELRARAHRVDAWWRAWMACVCFVGEGPDGWRWSSSCCQPVADLTCSAIAG